MRQASTTSMKHVKKGIDVPAAAAADPPHAATPILPLLLPLLKQQQHGIAACGGGGGAAVEQQRQQGVGRSNLQQGSDSHQFIVQYKCSNVSLHFCKDCTIYFVRE